MPKLFSTAYLPPIFCLALMATDMGGKVYIEACESYQKQSYRNRCRFYAADGVQSLNIPVIHSHQGGRIPIREVRIDYSKPWLIQHKRAIISAYRQAAYFDYYADDLFAILDSRQEKIFDLNTSLTRMLLDRMGIEVELCFTEEYSREAIVEGVQCADYRDIIHPKRPDTILGNQEEMKPYFQVFARKYGFINNLSSMDLLFNEGPQSLDWLRNAIHK